MPRDKHPGAARATASAGCGHGGVARGDGAAEDAAMSDFLVRDVPRLGKRVHRLGLAGTHGIDDAGIRAAIDQGVNYLFWTRGTMLPALRDAVRRDRERIVIATGPVIGHFRFTIRRAAEARLRELGADYLDVFHLFWAGVLSAIDERTLDELRRLKEEGKIRAIGTSIHDRPRAGRLAEDSPIDLFMLRYNAAHPGAEEDVFPHLARRKPAVVAYTATSWRKLLRAPKGWGGAPMTAGECYRFCLGNPNVDVVLTAPASREELEANLREVARGPLEAGRLDEVREFGRVVHG
jgi:aryl-alcohol dehydrogenase-like predicted oxidoreductase